MRPATHIRDAQSDDCGRLATWCVLACLLIPAALLLAACDEDETSLEGSPSAARETARPTVNEGADPSKAPSRGASDGPSERDPETSESAGSDETPSGESESTSDTPPATATKTRRASTRPTPARTGFAAEPQTWRVPKGPRDGGFGQGSAAAWSTYDIDDDGRLDIVWRGRVPSTPNTPVTPFDAATEPHWRVYLNEGGGFELSATTWRLPPELGDDPGWAFISAQNSFFFQPTTDARSHLVVMARPSPGGPQLFRNGDGEPIWRIYENTGDGFAEDATGWRIPARLADSTLSYLPLDIDADGIKDLVVQGHFDPATNRYSPLSDPSGRVVWHVHRGSLDGGGKPGATMGGFAAEHDVWTLPSDGHDIPESSPAWSLLDANRDDRLDVVRTAVLRADGSLAPLHDGTGSVWHAYLNDGSGFAETPTQMPIPEGSGTGYVTQNSDLAPQNPYAGVVGSWATVDMDGDDVFELLDRGQWTMGSTLAPWGEPDAPFWRLYERVETNGVLGFELRPTRWHLPVDIVLDYSQSVAYLASWFVIDIDGDGVMDLVKTSAWTAGPQGPRLEVNRRDGHPAWIVYRGHL